jgi:cell division protein FtsB
MLKYCIYIGLIAGAIAMQWSLWFGKGGFARLDELQTELVTIRAANEALRRENEALAAEIESLESGGVAVEERARLRLGMIRENEVLIRLVPEGELPANREETVTTSSGQHVFQPKRADLYGGGKSVKGGAAKKKQ